MELVDEKDIRGSRLVEHHTKYIELHGEDETVFITHTEHVRLHKKLRREGKCKIHSKILRRISSAALKRTEKFIKKHPDLIVDKPIIYMSIIDKKDVIELQSGEEYFLNI